MKTKRQSLIGSAVAIAAVVALVLYMRIGRNGNALSMPDLLPRTGRGLMDAELINGQRALGFYRDRIRKHPEVAENYTQLAEVYLQEARTTGRSDEYVPAARALLDAALNIAPGDFGATVTRASLLMSMHQFQRAREETEKVIAMNPHSAYAYGVLCDALVELGEYDAAVKACETMVRLRPDLRSFSRVSYLREIHGDREGSIAAMTTAANAGLFGKENRAWSLSVLANLFLHSGKIDTAEYIYKGILEERPEYARALAGLGQVAAARGDIHQATDFLRKATEAGEDHALMEQLADMYLAAGDKREGEKSVNHVISEFQEQAHFGWNVDREFAIFCADAGVRLDEALDCARREFHRRPKNGDALDTYAWVLQVSGRSGEALPLAAQALAVSPRNPAYLYHAGMIHASLGNKQKGAELLRTALAVDPYLGVLYHEKAHETLVALKAESQQGTDKL